MHKLIRRPPAKILALLLAFLVAAPLPALADALTYGDLVHTFNPSREVCTQDLDGDGSYDRVGEVVACQNGVCPVAAEVCAAERIEPICGEGLSHNPAAGRCEAPPVCASGVFDPATGLCGTTSSYTAALTGNGISQAYNVGLEIAGLQARAIYYHEHDGTFYPQPGSWIALGGSGVSSIYSVGLRAENGSLRVATRWEHEGEWSDSWAAAAAPLAGSGASTAPRHALESGSGRVRIGYLNDNDGYTWATWGGWIALAYSCPTGGTLDGTTCTVAATEAPICPAGSAVAGEMCAASPACPAGEYDPAAGACIGSLACPLGSQYACAAGSDGIHRCSTSPCQALGDPSTWIDESADLDDYQDDGERDPETGACLDEILIFNGRTNQCLNASVRTMFTDCCDMMGEMDVPDVVQHGVQAATWAYGAYQAYTALTAAPQVAYQLGQFSQVASGLSSAQYSLNAATAIKDTAGAYQASLEVANQFRNVSSAIQATTQAAQAGGVLANMGQAAMTMMTALGPTILISAALYFATSVLLKGCPPDGVDTAMAIGAGRSHKIGSYCKSKTPLGCIQRAEVHCTYQTKLARILHEQGRWQLASFNPEGLEQTDPRSGGWGTVKQPNCRGFRPDEFSSLDFGQIDMSEYFGEIQRKAAGAEALLPALQQQAAEFMRQAAP